MGRPPEIKGNEKPEKEATPFELAKKITLESLKKIEVEGFSEPEMVWNHILNGIQNFIKDNENKNLWDFLDSPENAELLDVLVVRRYNLGDATILAVIRTHLEQQEQIRIANEAKSKPKSS